MCHHGPDPIHIRSRCECHHVQQHQREDAYPYSFPAARCWYFCRTVRDGCWFCYRYCWRCWRYIHFPGVKKQNLQLTYSSSRKLAAASPLYRYGPNPHFRRGPRFIRRHRLYPHAHPFHRGSRVQVLGSWRSNEIERILTLVLHVSMVGCKAGK